MTASVRFLDSDGVTSITAENLADIFAGQNDTPRKIGFISTSDRNLLNVLISIGVVGVNDGAAMLREALDSASVAPTVSSPYGFQAAIVADAGTFAGTGTYGYVIAATKSGAETGPSPEITATITVTTQKVTLTWTQTPGATGYKIYRTPTPGSYGASSLLTTIGAGATVTFDDTGAATSSGQPAVDNRTGGWATTASLSAPAAGGTWGATGDYYWRVVALDSTGVEIANSLEVTINVNDTTKTVTVGWAAVAAADSFKIYRSTTPGVYTSPALVGTAGSGATSFIDTGAAPTTGALTTNPSYGIPPTSFGAGPLSAGTVVPNQEVFFWITRVTPAGTPEAGNPRQATIDVTES
jgi:hypothetical protein